VDIFNIGGLLSVIRTDPGMADVTYIEPLNLQAMTEIIEEERPDALNVL